MTVSTIAIIGAGNMGSSLVSGLIQHGHPASKLWVSDPSAEKLRHLEQLSQVNITTDNIQAISVAEVVILAVKPQILVTVLEGLREVVQARQPLVMSVAAGVRVEAIQQCLGGDAAIVRAMPNTPALIGCGATALYANHSVTPAQHNLAESILRSVGVVVWLEEESLLDVVTALSGSGPAYFFYLMEALQLAAEALGLPKEPARLLTLQTALGAARMALESGSSLADLRQKVTSPGGTTEKAIAVLEAHQVDQIYKKAIQAAKQRSEAWRRYSYEGGLGES